MLGSSASGGGREGRVVVEGGGETHKQAVADTEAHERTAAGLLPQRPAC